MRANTHVTLVVDNTAPQTQRSKCATPPQSFLTDQHPIYGGKAEVVRTQQSGGYWHFRMWISEERKYVRKTLKTTHLDTAVERAENEFFAIKANVNAGRRIFSPYGQKTHPRQEINSLANLDSPATESTQLFNPTFQVFQSAK